MNNEDTKLRIKKVAKHLFSLKGYDGTSTRDIVGAAGVNISMIAYHYGGKENLFYDILSDFTDSFHADAIDAPESIYDAVYDILHHILSLRFNDPELVSILHHEIILSSKRIENLKTILHPYWNKLEALLTTGKEQGIFEFNQVDNAIAFAMSVVIFPRNNAFFSEVLSDKTDTTEDINELLAFVFKGLRPTGKE